MSDIPREFDAMFRSENAQLYGMCVPTFRRLSTAGKTAQVLRLKPDIG
jgi:hypothetical protein